MIRFSAFLALAIFGFTATAQDLKLTTNADQLTTDAKRGIPIVYGTGDEIKEVGPIAKKKRKWANKKFSPGVKIGFYYERFHIFFLDVWTWNGKFVVFNDKGYSEPNPKQWRYMLGKSGTAKLSKPFGYFAPTGLIILVVLGIGLVALMLLGGGDDDEDEEGSHEESHHSSSMGNAA